MEEPTFHEAKLGSFTKEFIAGTAGGWGQILSGQPFDIIKVRMQSDPTRYSSVFQCFRDLVKSDGFFGFYKGSLIPLLGVGFCAAIQFSVLGTMKDIFKQQQNTDHLTLPWICAAGGIAGFANTSLSSPVEHIRIRLQVQTDGRFKGPFPMIKHIVKNHGVRGLYAGVHPTVWRETLGFSFYFGAYELVARVLAKSGGIFERDENGRYASALGNVLSTVAGGSAAGFAMWIGTFPFDTIKSKMQTDSFTKPKYSGMLDCFGQTVASQGVKGLFRGLTPCLLRAVPVNVTIFGCYEITKEFLAPY